MAVIYRHLKQDGEVFYIGIGKENKRAYDKKGRNKFWRDTVSKYEYEVQILKRDLTWKDACELEIILIAHYGRRDLRLGTLVNLTDGGDGQENPSEETRKKMSDAKQGIGGETHYFYGVPKTDEHKQKLREAKLGTKRTTESKNKATETRITNKSKELNYICSKSLKTWGSMIQCGNEIGVNSQTLGQYLNPNSKIKNPTTIMRYEDYLKYGAIEPHVVRKLEIIDTRNGQPSTTEDVAKEYRIGKNSVHAILKDMTKNYTYYVHKEDYDGTVRIPVERKGVPEPVINTITKEEFNRVSEAVRVSNYADHYLRDRLLGKIKNNTEFIFLKDYKGVELIPYRDLKEIQTVDTRTGEVIKDIRTASKLNGINRSSFHRRMIGELINDTFFVLLENYNGEIHYPEEGYNRIEQVINIETKEIFKNKTHAAKTIDMCPKLLANKLNKNNKSPNNTPFVLLKDYNNLLKK